MAGDASHGSPTMRRTLASKSASTAENTKIGKEETSVADSSEEHPSRKKSFTALAMASLVNQSRPKKMKLSHEPSCTSASPNSDSMDKLLTKLSEQQAALHKQNEALNVSHDDANYPSALDLPSCNSVPITPGTDNIGHTAPTTRPASAIVSNDHANSDEVLRLKLELARAKNTISQLASEGATQALPPKPEFGRNSPNNANFLGGGMLFEYNQSRLPRMGNIHPGNAVPMGREVTHPWSSYDDSRSDTSDALSATGYNRARNIWGSEKVAPFPGNSFSGPKLPQSSNTWAGRGGNLVDQGSIDPSIPYNAPPGPNRYRVERQSPGYGMTVRAPPTNRRSGRFDNRLGPFPFNNQAPYCGNPNYYGQGQFYNASNMSGPSQYQIGMNPVSSHQPPPIGTPLSPLASEFTSECGPWKTESATGGSTYIAPTEPLNYRRLLDRSVTCNWKYIIDKIVCNNDQQASIFLQQKLKVCDDDQRHGLVAAIALQAHPLMVNRFGNFLVQRGLENGTTEQIIKIAEAIRGNTISLSMDGFGCHVIQKAFDWVPEDYKAIMVHELLRRIPETIIHKNACHVWQKLFELRWTKSPPQIMKYVNEALQGMWHEVALGETGSLVVQNIFENCLEEDKRPCIEEVLANIDIVAHGQFGNWCIQHICEHGAPADRSRAIDHVIRFATEYSMDQYASKVVEKCLKIGGGEFLGRYLDRVCEGRMDRPRIPLIDIASDQYGNYLIQWILTHSTTPHREIVTAHIRKHMVSLRGSKFGSRVGMLCTNPAVATRPGPGIGSNIGRVAGYRFGRTY